MDPKAVANSVRLASVSTRHSNSRSSGVQKWQTEGYEIIPLGKIVGQVLDAQFKPKASPNKNFTFLRVRYDGVAELGETRLGREVTYSQVQCATENDLVASNIAMALGAICVLPKELTNTLISPEFTIMRVKDNRFNPWFLWGFLRSPEVRARLLSQSTGISRHRIAWDFLKDIPVPLVDFGLQTQVAEQYRKAVLAIREAEQSRQLVDTTLPGEEGGRNCIWGTPQAPAKGASPLWSPLFQ